MMSNRVKYNEGFFFCNTLVTTQLDTTWQRLFDFSSLQRLFRFESDPKVELQINSDSTISLELTEDANRFTKAITRRVLALPNQVTVYCPSTLNLFVYTEYLEIQRAQRVLVPTECVKLSSSNAEFLKNASILSASEHKPSLEVEKKELFD